MQIKRREFLVLIGAAGLAACGRLRRAHAEGVFLGGGQYKARADAPVQYVMSVIDLSDGKRDLVPMGFLPHGIHAHPQTQERLALFEKKGPGACEYDLRERRLLRVIAPVENRHFYGHGVYTADGAVLLSTEANVDSYEGAIGMRDSSTMQYLGAFPSYGQSPHECKLIDDGKTLVVTNGGGQLDGARPSVTYIDVATQRLLDTVHLESSQLNAGHLAVAADGALVVVSAPRQGLEKAGLGGVSMGRPAPVLDRAAPPQAVAARLHGEALSVAILDSRDLVAVTHPDGDLVTFWSLSQRRLIKTLSLHRPRGVALDSTQQAFIISCGEQAGLVRVPVDTLEAERNALVEQSYMTGSHIYNWSRHMAEVHAPRAFVRS